MRNSQQQSIAGGVGKLFGILFGGIFAAGALMAVMFISGAITKIPTWVLVASALLYAIAIGIAVRRKDARGLMLGATIFFAGLAALGMPEALSLPAPNPEGAFSFERTLAELQQFIAVAYPLVACAVAIVLPIGYPRKQSA